MFYDSGIWEFHGSGRRVYATLKLKLQIFSGLQLALQLQLQFY